MNSPKTLISLSAFLLLGSAVLGVLNGTKVKNLRADVGRATAERDVAQRQRAALEKTAKPRVTTTATAQTPKAPENESHIASAEEELIKSQTEKSDLQAKLQANEAQISEMQKRIDELSKSPSSPNPGAPSPTELQAQLEDARKQLEGAEREKAFISERTPEPQRADAGGPQVAVKRAVAPAFHSSVRGTVLAVNDAYNFVVLDLGHRQGLEANAEMLVLRDGALIGKIRISSVEPATAIGDILGNSLARGVQVQPGDTVIYAGSNS